MVKDTAEQGSVKKGKMDLNPPKVRDDLFLFRYHIVYECSACDAFRAAE